jgi:hypothetical protein
MDQTRDWEKGIDFGGSLISSAWSFGLFKCKCSLVLPFSRALLFSPQAPSPSALAVPHLPRTAACWPLVRGRPR